LIACHLRIDNRLERQDVALYEIGTTVVPTLTRNVSGVNWKVFDLSRLAGGSDSSQSEQ
jgi:hypothetical protein